MQTTTNYNLLLAEGTDLVNYLTQTNPNFSDLDTIVKAISDATISPAAEVTVGTAHSITRTLADCNVFRFTATSNWVTGDTITIDGNAVTALKTDGTTLKSGDYVIGSEVLCILIGTRLTVFVSSAAPVYASDIVFDKTIVGVLTANNTQAAIDEITARSCATTFDTAVTISGTTGYTCPNDGYMICSNSNSTTGRLTIRINSVIILNDNDMTKIANNTVYTLLVRKGMTIRDESTADSYTLRFISFKTS